MQNIFRGPFVKYLRKKVNKIRMRKMMEGTFCNSVVVISAITHVLREVSIRRVEKTVWEICRVLTFSQSFFQKSELTLRLRKIFSRSLRSQKTMERKI